LNNYNKIVIEREREKDINKYEQDHAARKVITKINRESANE